MFGVSETPYDLRFRLLKIPVRVHPLFWLVAAMLGWRQNDMPTVLIWVSCVFVSILVHEYGHGLMAKTFGCIPSITLWMGGGLCYSQMDRQTPRQRLAVVLSGPGAGFVLCGVVMLIFSALVGLTPREHLSLVLSLLRLPADSDALLDAIRKLGRPETTTFTCYWYLVQINIFWGLVNLLPVWPLDGGRVSEILLSYFNPHEGARWGHIISLLVAGVLAILAYTATSDLFLTVFFGYFAFVNFQILQSIHQAQMMGHYNDEDWWRR
jgi:Zn-dependent protease